MSIQLIAYCLLAAAASGFYAVRAYHIVRPAPWWQLWHQVWFNLAGSVMGWALGYWVFNRVSQAQIQVGAMDALLMLFAALGIVGYVPQTLNAIPGLLEYLSKLAQKQFEHSGEECGSAKANVAGRGN